MIVQHFNAETDAFFRGEGVDVAADGIYLPGNFLSRAVRGSLENHVLDEMRDPVPLLVFVARPGFYPDPDTNRADVLHLLSDNHKPVGEHFASDVPVLVHNSYCHILLQSTASFP